MNECSQRLLLEVVKIKYILAIYIRKMFSEICNYNYLYIFFSRCNELFTCLQPAFKNNDNLQKI